MNFSKITFLEKKLIKNPPRQSSSHVFPVTHSLGYPPSAWTLRKPDHRPCTQDHWCLRRQAGMWSNLHSGQTWRVLRQPQILAAVLWRRLYPWLHSSTRNMKPTETRPLPDRERLLFFIENDWRLNASVYKNKTAEITSVHIYSHIKHMI